MDAVLPVRPKKSKRPAWKRSVWKQLWIDKTTYAMIAPFMLGFLVFQVAAVFIAMGMSFTDYNIFTPPSFVGLSNYISMFLNDDIFVTALQNTLLLAFVTGPLSFVACFMFAWLINELPRRIRSVLTVLLYAPTLSQLNFLSFVIVFGGMRYAYVNSFLLRLGIIDKPIQFFNDPKYMMGVVIIVTIWMSLGVSFLAFIAGLKTVDPQLYEAASIDGIKNRFQELIYVTLPNMKPQLMFGAVMQIAAAFSCGNVSANLNGAIPVDYATYTIAMHITDYGSRRYEMGYASAMSVILFLFLLLTHKIISKFLMEEN